MTYATRRTAEDCGNLVFDVLAAHRGDLIKLDDVAAEAGLTAAHVQKGIVYLREVLASDRSVAFISKLGPGGGVGLTDDAKAIDAYLYQRSTVHATQIGRELAGSLDVMVATAPKSRYREVTNLQLSWKRLQEDVERLRDAIPHNGTTV